MMVNIYLWHPEQSSVVDPGCISRIPDPKVFHPGSRIRGQKDSRIRIRIRIK